MKLGKRAEKLLAEITRRGVLVVEHGTLRSRNGYRVRSYGAAEMRAMRSLERAGLVTVKDLSGPAGHPWSDIDSTGTVYRHEVFLRASLDYEKKSEAIP